MGEFPIALHFLILGKKIVQASKHKKEKRDLQLTARGEESEEENEIYTIC